METINGVDHVIDLCLVVGGELKEVRAFYYPSQGPRNPLCWQAPRTAIMQSAQFPAGYCLCITGKP
jgi:hypothetical protein